LEAGRGWRRSDYERWQQLRDWTLKFAAMGIARGFEVGLFLSLAACMVGVGTIGAAQTGERMKSWAEMLDAVKEDEGLKPAREVLVAEARKAAALPIIRRVYTLEDVGKHRTWLDGRARNLDRETAQIFALAMSDFSACSALAAELPLLAAAYRLTGEEVFRKRVVEQLEETATWSPLQRPGWTCFAPGNRLPPDGKDGNWLATGTGVRAIADAIEIMPADSVPAELRGRIEDLLAREIDGVVDDWKTKRAWFIRGDNPITNQWMLPTEGLVRASLVLGADKHREAYELGVKNALRALDAHGPQGEFEEGIGYAAFTVTSMLHTAHAMAAAGDRRALDHPFLRNFPTWMAHHIQPGGMVINCFDAGAARRVEGLRGLLSLLAVCTGSPVARWALAHQISGPMEDMAGLLCRALPPSDENAAPALYAAYERATRANWRDSWQDDATGVWVRGGHALDQHDHYDRGHVNFIHRGKPILIEAGTPSYDNPRIASHYQSVVGHNVLQVGSETGRKAEAPMVVHALNARGGDVTVDAARCYDGVKVWRRRVRWSSKSLAVTDEVALEDGKEDVVLFRWHVGTPDTVAVRGGGRRHTVQWADATMRLEGSAALEVTQEMLPDNTLGPRGEGVEPLHTCVIVKSSGKVRGLRLKTTVAPQ
jgi:hypothetical protein